MAKRKAISAMGVGIIFVIVLGIVMIISAPMMADKAKNTENSHQSEQDRVVPDHYDRNYDDNSHSSGEFDRSEFDRLRNDTRMEISRLESNIDSRIESRVRDILNDFERRKQTERPSNQPAVTNKYICTPISFIDEQGNTVYSSAGHNSKIVKINFECELPQ